MSICSRSFGRRAIAAVVSLGLVTSVTTVAPTTFIAPAVAQPGAVLQARGQGELSVDSSTVVGGQTITVTATGFEPRTGGQGLAVDLSERGKPRHLLDLGDGTVGTSFDRMATREENGPHYGVITSAKNLPTAENKGTVALKIKLPINLKPRGKYTLTIKGGNKAIGGGPAVVKFIDLEAARQEAFLGRPDHPDILYPVVGATVTGTFAGLPVGTRVNALGTSNDEETVADNWLPAGDYVAGNTGTVQVQNIHIPATAQVGKAIYLQVTLPDGTQKLIDGRRYGLNPNVPESNTAAIKILAEGHTPTGEGGLYQSAYDPNHKQLFITQTNFGDATSVLYKADATSMKLDPLVKYNKIEDAVFGVAYDPKTDTVWTTNTKGPSVTVYKSDGTKIATLPLENRHDGHNTAHPRDVVIHNGKAYVGDAGYGGKIYVFDVAGIKDNAAPETTIELSTFGKRGVLEMKIDDATNTLWTVSFNSKYLGKVELGNNNAVTTYDLGNEDQEAGDRGAGIAIDTKRGNVYAATQSPAFVKVFNIKEAKVIKTIVTGAAPLDTLYDPVKDVVYTVNRAGGTVNVIDPATFKILATKAIAPYPNQISTDGMGNVFITTKAFYGRVKGGNTGFPYDTIYKLTYDKKGKDTESTTPSGSSKPGDSSSKPNEKTHSSKDASSNNKVNSSNQKDKKEGSSKQAGIFGVLGVLAALIGAIFFAVQSGALNHLLPAGFTLPHFPGFPK